ncbi:monofunctional biosynthetic peptidoglycan transglycosylase [Chelativorans sp. M5D2P16]|uniref:monofunctional biosynthetic peptidoglycan transglycosylase n=1 Tax=Chelativorans sp. M5D2P16 TaxID=3095678 RepID=UPI002ACAA75C|nr:monofunctional biosynthetic peptidoglycan transglycosylase [Chelativorans sp. M5D2P16]MDZ5699361.1 monofunctional biosynthetic peptidoglycan transglycosylase [Chelativorans sp. M5D2P16]
MKAEKRSHAALKRKRARRHTWRRWLRRIIAVIVILVLLPLGLTVLYRLSFVHPVSTLMLADLVKLEGYDRRWIPLDEMGNVVVHSVMMSEDGQFCAHSGVDWGALNTVVSEALSGERTRGASTIPMQTVKNLFLWPGRSFVRKALEAPLSIYFDAVVPKRRIMEIYMNIAEWGPNIYGVEAAARHHFGRPAKDLTRRQAALLAVTLPNPKGRDPANPSSGLNRLASIIQERARMAGAYVGCLDRAGG